MTKIGLALGAGGARGIAHIQVFHAFDDLGIKPVVISGTSIGAIMGATYASGMSAAEIEAHIRDKFSNYLKPFADAMRLNPGDVMNFFKNGGPRLGELNLERLLGNFLPEQMPVSFEELKIPLNAVATDYYSETDKTFSSGPLMPALAASAALPAIFLPVEIGGRFYVDGGLINPTPFDILEDQCDITVAIDVCGGTGKNVEKRPKKIDVIYATSALMQKTIVEQKRQRYRVDLFNRPSLGGLRVLDFFKTDMVLKETAGLREAMKLEIDALLSAR